MVARALDSTKHGSNLNDTVMLVGWPTPCAQDGPNGGPSQGSDRLPGAVSLTHWPTPLASQTNAMSPESAEREIERRKSIGAGQVGNLRVAAALTSWPTPTVADARRGAFATEELAKKDHRGRQLPTEAALSSWPTPTVNDSKGSDYSYGNGDHDKICLKLPGAAKLAAWSTPLASDGDKTDCLLPTVLERMQDGKQISTAMQARLTSWATPLASNVRAIEPEEFIKRKQRTRPSSVTVTELQAQAKLASWATPAASEAGGTPEQFLARKQKANENGSQIGMSVTSLAMQAQLATWATPAARDFRSNSASEEWHQERAEQTRGKPLSEQVHQLLDSGETPSGSTAATASTGQLNPDLSRWLMGIPSEWSTCAPSSSELKAASGKSKRTGTRSTRFRPRLLSERLAIPCSTSGESPPEQQTPSDGCIEDENEDEMANVNSARRKALMDKLSKARASGVGNNFKDGKYRLAIKKMGLEDGFKGTRFQSTFTVVASQKIAVVELSTNKALDVTPNPVGSDVDWLAMDLDKEDSAGPGNVRRLIMDLFDRKELSDEEYIETLAEMCDLDEEGNPLKEPLNLAKGMLIDMETVRIVTKKNKKEIVVCKWSHVPHDSYDQQAMSKWLDEVAVQTQAHQQQLAAAAQAQLPAGSTPEATA